MSEEAEPSSVWDKLRRADDFVKYANNRPDPSVSFASARELLDEAARSLSGMSPGQREFFLAQIAIRRRDIDSAIHEKK